jgi:hypothetical protein
MMHCMASSMQPDAPTVEPLDELRRPEPDRGADPLTHRWMPTWIFEPGQTRSGYDRRVTDGSAFVDEIASELVTWPGVRIERREDGAAVVRYEHSELGEGDPSTSQDPDY